MDYIEFPKLGIHLDINPIAIENIFGSPLSVRWYGVIIATAIMVALILAMRQSKRFNIKDDDFIDMFLVVMPVSIIFARLFFVVFTWEDFKNDLWGIFRIWEGGIAIFGVLIGAIISVAIFCRVRKIDALNLLDFACVYLPLAQAIGRWGNFTNQELYGSPTNLLWGMTGSRIGDTPVHPTFLYEGILNIIVFIVLLQLRKKKKVKGSVFAMYLMLYSLVRFMMEFIRTDEFGSGSIRYNQVVAAIMFVGAFIWLVYLTKRSNKIAQEKGMAAEEDESIMPNPTEEFIEESDEAKEEDIALSSEDINDKG